MLNILFSYNYEYEFHGPLELVFIYLEVIELVDTSFKVCRNIFLASIESLWKRYQRRGIYRILDKQLSERIVALLLEKKSFDITLDNNRAIRYCSIMGFISSVKSLLRNKKCDPSAKSLKWDEATAITAIGEASKNGHVEVVRLLLADKCVDPSDWNNCAIKWASSEGHIEVVKILLADKRVDLSEAQAKNFFPNVSSKSHLSLKIPKIHHKKQLLFII